MPQIWYTTPKYLYVIHPKILNIFFEKKKNYLKWLKMIKLLDPQE